MDFYNPSHILNGSSGVDEFGVHSKLFNNLRKSNFLPSFSLSLSLSLIFFYKVLFHMLTTWGNELKTRLEH